MRSLPTDKIINCFYDSSDDCVKVIDPYGSIMSFNPGGLAAMDIDDPADVIGKDWLSFWDGNLRDIALAAVEKARRGQPASFEGYCPTFKGVMKYWEVSVVPLLSDNGDVQWLLVNSRDATKRKDMESEVRHLRKQVKLLQKQLDAIND